MIDLEQYYLDNIEEGDYYYRFFPLIEGVNKTYNIFCGEVTSQDFEFVVHDEIEAIEKFRSLCQPENKLSSTEDKCWFYVIAYYLDACGYIIEQFPDVLRRPPAEPSLFTYNAIRDRAISLGLVDDGAVLWATRRMLVADMKFVRKTSSIAIGENLGELVQRISAGNSRFEEMEVDEQLREIANLIEHLLKKNGKFVQPDYSKVTLGYVDDNTVRMLRDKLQCFRHSSSESLKERTEFTEEQKGTVKNLAHFSDSLISPPSGAATPPAESRPDSASSPTRSRPRT